MAKIMKLGVKVEQKVGLPLFLGSDAEDFETVSGIFRGSWQP